MKIEKVFPGIGPKRMISFGKGESGPPPGAPGGRGDKNKMKSVLVYSWVTL
jgi:hypothetical protein